MPNDKPSSWRDVLTVHPAADLFPMMSADELKALGEDIKRNGLQVRPVMWQAEENTRVFLIDGRNRLDAMESAKLPVLEVFDAIQHIIGGDPYELVLSLNLHRRHLTAEQKRDLIAKLIKAQPQKSNRTIAEQSKVDHKTVGVVRDKLEAGGEIPHHALREDARGTMQPAHKLAPKPAPMKAHAEAVADRAEQRSRQTQHTAEQTQKAAQAVAMPEQPPNDVVAAENAAAQLLYELEDLAKEFEQIAARMTALAGRLFDSLDMRDGETVADFLKRIDPEHPFDSDKPQALIASIGIALSFPDDLRSTIKSLDLELCDVLQRRAPADEAPAQPSAPDAYPDLPDCLDRNKPAPAAASAERAP